MPRSPTLKTFELKLFMDLSAERDQIEGWHKTTEEVECFLRASSIEHEERKLRTNSAASSLCSEQKGGGQATHGSEGVASSGRGALQRAEDRPDVRTGSDHSQAPTTYAIETIEEAVRAKMHRERQEREREFAQLVIARLNQYLAGQEHVQQQPSQRRSCKAIDHRYQMALA